jgi:hypothetical protein
MELLLTAILLGAVVTIIAGPLRRSGGHAEHGAQSQRRALETAKEAKYREILDAELDFLTGKLSEPDYRDVDRRLRVEAGELLGRLDAGATKDDPR